MWRREGSSLSNTIPRPRRVSRDSRSFPRPPDRSAMMDERSTPDPAAAGRPDPRGGGSAADRLWWYRDARLPDPPVLRARRRPTRRERIDALACLAVSTLCFSRARSETLFIDDWDFYNRMPLGAPMLVAL